MKQYIASYTYPQLCRHPIRLVVVAPIQLIELIGSDLVVLPCPRWLVPCANVDLAWEVILDQ